MTTNWPKITMSTEEYKALKERNEFRDKILSMPEVQAMIAKINALGEEIKELKDKCKQLQERNDERDQRL